MLVRIGRVGFWVSPGFGRLLVYPLGFFTFKTFTFKIPVWAFISMGVGRSCQAWYRFNRPFHGKKSMLGKWGRFGDFDTTQLRISPGFAMLIFATNLSPYARTKMLDILCTYR